MDIVNSIIEFEEGGMSSEEQVKFFQELIDTGLCWELQGSYGRYATALIDAGYCTPNVKKGG